ncbi:GDSL esterase/lipase At5g55050 [Humulus lupulus]|uniref:GDSL esterase/lipase At5g55050 n=1 Tax=Humulus lupulus TaxID=3486 RepID=UPI002B40BBDC|nr:GDSL esterase/lipase At5g55050 [Humulus lupulus]
MGSLLFFFCIIFSLFQYSCSEAQKVTPAIYVFGDSLVDVGNNNHLALSLAKANFPHNGIDFPGKKPTGRFCNGRNAADFLAEKVGLPSSPPYLSLVYKKNTALFINGTSFASGGAGIFNGTDEVYRQSLPLTKQVEYYSTVHDKQVQQLGSTRAEQHFSKSLFTIVIGSNDLFGYFGSSKLRNRTTPEEYVDKMIVTLKEQLKRLHSYGARKFVMIGIGPIGCCPAQRRKSSSGDCFQEMNDWAIKYNDGLKSTLRELKSELNNINYSYFETYDVLNNLVQHPASYGFTEVKSACCGLGKFKSEVPCLPIAKYCSNRRDHVFWDLYHPTEATHSILSDYIFDGPPKYIFPLSVKQLVAL